MLVKNFMNIFNVSEELHGCFIWLQPNFILKELVPSFTAYKIVKI